MAVNVIGFFCEDIREEKTGLITLVGVLPDNINIPQPPPDSPPVPTATLIGKLGLYVRFSYGLEETPRGAKISLRFPEEFGELNLGVVEPEVFEKAASQARENNLPHAGVVHHAILHGFQIPGPGLVVAVVEMKGEKQICAILNVVSVASSSPSSTASVQPS